MSRTGMQPPARVALFAALLAAVVVDLPAALAPPPPSPTPRPPRRGLADLLLLLDGRPDGGVGGYLIDVGIGVEGGAVTLDVGVDYDLGDAGADPDLGDEQADWEADTDSVPAAARPTQTEAGGPGGPGGCTSTATPPPSCTTGNAWLRRCTSQAFCLIRSSCTVYSDCVGPTDCGPDGYCRCRHAFDSDYTCFGNSLYAIAAALDCSSEDICAPDTDYLSTTMALALAFGACFIGMAAAMLACRTWIRRWTVADPGPGGLGRGGGGGDGDGDSDSVSSMQRWINERLRHGPPRYEEMDSAPTPASASPARAAAPPGPPGPTGPPGPRAPTTLAALAAVLADKPPAYEVAISGSETASCYCPPVADESPPPPYTVVGGLGGFSNPCFDGDVSSAFTAQPAPPQTAPPSTDSPALSSTSSMTSLSTLSSSWSSSSDQPPANLLTLSQVVALREAAAAARGGCTDLEWTSPASPC